MRRCPGNVTPGGDIRGDRCAAPHDGSRTNGEVAARARPAAHQDAVLEHSRAGEPSLACNQAVAANTAIVADLHEIVDLGALPYHRVAKGAAVDGRIGADLD